MRSIAPTYLRIFLLAILQFLQPHVSPIPILAFQLVSMSVLQVLHGRTTPNIPIQMKTDSKTADNRGCRLSTEDEVSSIDGMVLVVQLSLAMPMVQAKWWVPKVAP